MGISTAMSLDRSGLRQSLFILVSNGDPICALWRASKRKTSHHVDCLSTWVDRKRSKSDERFATVKASDDRVTSAGMVLPSSDRALPTPNVPLCPGAPRGGDDMCQDVAQFIDVKSCVPHQS
jgi:hypothetical protein